jgi:small-conductance mechanosensitive channel
MTYLDIFVNLPYIGPQDIEGLLEKTAAVVAIVVAAGLVIRLAHVLVRRVVSTMLNRELLEGGAGELTEADLKKRQDTIDSLAGNVIRIFVIVVAGLMVLETTFRVDIGPAVAGLGIAGIAIGLGTQSLVRDYLNGALIMLENQYAVGDVVNVAGIGGVVEDFTLRRTTLRDLSGTVHTIPNGQINVASNLTRAWARVNEHVQVVYGTDLEKASQVIDGVGRELAADPDFADRILEAPHVERIDELGDRGINLLVLGKVRASAQWAVAGEFRRRLLSAFEVNGIAMPTGVILTWSGVAAPDGGADARERSEPPGLEGIGED